MQEIAKPYTLAFSEITRSLEYFDDCIYDFLTLENELYTGDRAMIKNKLGIFKRVPKGVILIITPFNYPINLLISKLIPALLSGNAVVIKPATQGSITLLTMFELIISAG
jgi:glyceraldehyde-3-phosphate dehydrogenase (NADP+)